MDLTQKDRKVDFFFMFAFGMVLFLFAIYLFVLLYFILQIDSINISQTGVFGDSFGALTALFSGLAFAGLLISIKYQRQDLGLTKKELEDTRNELKRQHTEKTFFQLIGLYSDIVNGLDVKTKKGDEIKDIATGRDSFDRLYGKLKNRFENIDRFPLDNDANRLQIVYDDFWHSWQKDLGHYFRHLYTIYKFIKKSDIDNKKFYSNVIRSQLSDFELLALFYYCLTSYGLKFKPLVEKYALFDNLPANLVLDVEHIKRYSVLAYGKNEHALKIYSSELV